MTPAQLAFLIEETNSQFTSSSRAPSRSVEPGSGRDLLTMSTMPIG
jgi:hypothetical protein